MPIRALMVSDVGKRGTMWLTDKISSITVGVGGRAEG